MVWLLWPACAASPSPPCCRWSANPTCSPVVHECSQLHEYLEHKTTTHHFEDVVTCLGNDPKNWAVQFDGTTSDVTLSNGSTEVAVPTPLKVTHAADCAGTAPKLSLQMDTVALGTLMVGGFDVAKTFQDLYQRLGTTPPASGPASPPPPSAPSGASGGCCRWTASGACSPAEGKCTKLHEYLERKTTTHHFDDVYGCFGNNMEDWEMQFDGTTSNVTLFDGSTAVAAVPTPLKVVHPPRCHFDAPTLYLQEGTYP